MTEQEQRIAIAEALWYELLEVDYESFTPEPGLARGADGIWRTPSANKWARQIEAQNVKCVGRYFVRLSDQQIFADFDGPDTGDNGRGQFDWLHDLNAMRETVKTLPKTKRGHYNAELFKLATQRNLSSAIKEPQFIFDALNATAAQRAEAFLRTLGKWVDAEGKP